MNIGILLSKILIDNECFLCAFVVNSLLESEKECDCLSLPRGFEEEYIASFSYVDLSI